MFFIDLKNDKSWKFPIRESLSSRNLKNLAIRESLSSQNL